MQRQHYTVSDSNFNNSTHMINNNKVLRRFTAPSEKNHHSKEIVKPNSYDDTAITNDSVVTGLTSLLYDIDNDYGDTQLLEPSTAITSRRSMCLLPPIIEDSEGFYENDTLSCDTASKRRYKDSSSSSSDEEQNVSYSKADYKTFSSSDKLSHNLNTTTPTTNVEPLPYSSTLKSNQILPLTTTTAKITLCNNRLKEAKTSFQSPLSHANTIHTTDTIENRVCKGKDISTASETYSVHTEDIDELSQGNRMTVSTSVNESTNVSITANPFSNESKKSSNLPTTSSRISPYSTKNIYGVSDRKFLAGCRVHSSGDVFTPRFKLSTVFLTPSQESSWSLRFGVLGGNCSEDESTQYSSYYEADFDETSLLGHGSLQWRRESLSPQIESLYGHSAVSLTGVDSDKFVIFGGSSSPSLFGAVYVVDASTKLTYASSTTGQQPPSRTEHSCVLINSTLYVFGGKAMKNKKKNNQSRTLPDAPSSVLSDIQTTVSDISNDIVSNANANQHQDFLQPCKVFNDLWKLDLRDFEWIQIPLQPELMTQSLTLNGNTLFEDCSTSSEQHKGHLIPRGRAGHVAVSWNDACYIMGGFDGETVLGDVWCLSSSEKWRQCFPKGRQIGCRLGAASTVCGDLWLIHGGITETAQVINDFIIIDLITWSSSRVRVDVHRNPARLLPSLAFHAAVTVPMNILQTSKHDESAKAVILLGGYGKSGAKSNAIYTVIPSRVALDAVSYNRARQPYLKSFLPPFEMTSTQSQNTSLTHRSTYSTGSSKCTPEQYPETINNRNANNNNSLYGVVEQKDNNAENLTSDLVAPSPIFNTITTNSHPSSSESCFPMPGCISCIEIQKLVDELQLQNSYLSARLSEQKTENLALRSSLRQIVQLQQTLNETEDELESYRSLRRHPLLGQVMQGCLNALESTKKFDTHLSQESGFSCSQNSSLQNSQCTTCDNNNVVTNNENIATTTLCKVTPNETEETCNENITFGGDPNRCPICSAWKTKLITPLARCGHDVVCLPCYDSNVGCTSGNCYSGNKTS